MGVGNSTLVDEALAGTAKKKNDYRIKIRKEIHNKKLHILLKVSREFSGWMGLAKTTPDELSWLFWMRGGPWQKENKSKKKGSSRLKSISVSAKLETPNLAVA